MKSVKEETNAGSIAGYDKFVGNNEKESRKRRTNIYQLNYNEYSNIVIGKDLSKDEKQKIRKFMVQNECKLNEITLKFKNIDFPAELYV